MGSFGCSAHRVPHLCVEAERAVDRPLASELSLEMRSPVLAARDEAILERLIAPFR
jgi:hypothetical protein